MEVIYRKTITTQICELKEQADIHYRNIEKIILTEDEWNQLQFEAAGYIGKLDSAVTLVCNILVEKEVPPYDQTCI